MLGMWLFVWDFSFVFFRQVDQQGNFQQEAHQPILSYSLIDTLPKRTLMWSHNISAPLALLSCFTDLSFKHKRTLSKKIKKPALCIKTKKHQVMCKTGAMETSFYLCVGRRMLMVSCILKLANKLLQIPHSLCCSTVHIFSLGISYLCISVFVTFNTLLCEKRYWGK